MKTALSKIFLFFCEDDGRPSSQRLIFVIGSLYTMFMGWWVYSVTKDFAATIAVVTALSGVFGAQKLIQKSMEK